MPALPLYSRTPVSCWSTSKRPGWPNWPAETAPRRIVEQGKRACPLANSPSPAHAYLPRLCADLVRTQTASSSEQNSTQPDLVGKRRAASSSVFSQSAHGYHSPATRTALFPHRFHRTNPSSWFDDHLRFHS